MRPEVYVIGVEERWKPRLTESLRAGRVVELPPFHTDIEIQFPRSTSELNLLYVRNFVDEIVLGDDDEVAEAAHMLWEEVEMVIGKDKNPSSFRFVYDAVAREE